MVFLEYFWRIIVLYSCVPFLFDVSNFDLSSSLLTQTKMIKKFSSTFFKRWRGYGASSPVSRRFFGAFFAPVLSKKAAKRLCCQDLLDAFSFATRGTKEKALQKEKCRFFAQAAGLPLLKKRSKIIAWVCANSPINPNFAFKF